MNFFSCNNDRVENIGELVLEVLLSSNIDSITDLGLSGNESWFKNPNSLEERSYNVDLLLELISKQAGLQKIGFGGDKDDNNAFSSIAT